MDQEQPTNSINDLLAALADGELDLRANPDALAKIAQDPQAAQRIAYQQQLKQACDKAMDRPEMKCPEALAHQLRVLAGESRAQTPPQPHAHSLDAVDAAGSNAPPSKSTATAATPAHAGPPVIARIGQWFPAAVAAVLLIAATVMFMQSSGNSASTGVASLLSVKQVEYFDARHGDCALKPEMLKDHEAFGPARDIEQLPGKLGEYFQASTDGIHLSLSDINYDYQLTGACNLPGTGFVHIVYRHHDDPSRAISVWLAPDHGDYDALEPDRVYVEAGKSLDRAVIVWRSKGMVYYLVGDSLQDAHQAVAVLHDAI